MSPPAPNGIEKVNDVMEPAGSRQTWRGEVAACSVAAVRGREVLP